MGAVRSPRGRPLLLLLLAGRPRAGAPSAPPGTVAGIPAGLIAGACSKLLRDVVIHPLDTVKSRRQMALSAGDAAQRPPLYANLYDGIGPTLVTGVPAGALFLYVGDLLRSQHLNSGLSGAAASLVFWTIRTPGEVVKTRMQVEGGGGGSAAGLVGAVRDLCREEGPGALYTGYVQTLCRSLPFDFLRFLLFDAIHDGELTRQLLAGSPWSDMACGFAASGAAALLTQPLDVLKTLEQGSRRADGRAGGARELVRRTTASNVLQLWWAGAPERVLLAAMSGSIYFGAYDVIKRAIEAAAA